MHVQRTHHIDASESDEAGMHEYHYEYDIYRFSDGVLCFTARSYVDQPGEAHFLGIEVRGKSRLMVDRDLAQPLFLSAFQALLNMSPNSVMSIRAGHSLRGKAASLVAPESA